jgi:peptidyl-prolyl cis-trans isomerase D
MLTLIRKFARSRIAQILIFLLVIAFTNWGVSDVMNRTNTDSVATIGKVKISSAEFKSEFERLLKRAKQQENREVTVEEARAQGLDSMTLERMVSERSFAALLSKFGIRVADQVAKDEISKIPGFQDPSTNSFSERAYQAALSENGFSIAQFEASVRDDMARQLLVMAATSGFHAPAAISTQVLAYATERRSVTMIAIPASLAGATPSPTEAQINAFYADYRERLMRPETRDLTIVSANLAAFVSRAQVNPAQVRQVFETQKANLTVPEKRTFVQIVAQDKSKADLAAARLRAGQAPNQIATALGLQAPLVFTDVSQDQVPDSAVGRAVFAANTGAVAAVQGSLAFAAFQVSNIKPAQAPNFDSVSVTIAAQLRREAAGQLMTDATTVFDDALAQGDNIEVAAQKAGFQVIKVTNVTAQGADLSTNQPVAALTNATQPLRDAFQLAAGDNTELVNAGQDAYIAIRADKINVAAPVPLAQVRTDIIRAWTERETATRLKARADVVLADAKATTLEAAAAKHHLQVVRAPQPIARGQGSSELSQAIFTAKKGDMITGPVANGVEYAVVRVDNIIRDDETRAPERLAQAEQEVRQSFQQDIVETIERVARNRSRARIYNDRMRKAFGDNVEDSGPALVGSQKSK